jgi:hypothetical protein
MQRSEGVPEVRKASARTSTQPWPKRPPTTHVRCLARQGPPAVRNSDSQYTTVASSVNIIYYGVIPMHRRETVYRCRTLDWPRRGGPPQTTYAHHAVNFASLLPAASTSRRLPAFCGGVAVRCVKLGCRSCPLPRRPHLQNGLDLDLLLDVPGLNLRDKKRDALDGVVLPSSASQHTTALSRSKWTVKVPLSDSSSMRR